MRRAYWLLLACAAGCGESDAVPTTRSLPAIAGTRSTRATRPQLDVARSRAEAIKQTSDELRAQCQAAAGGDWEKWERETARYRDELRGRVREQTQGNLLLEKGNTLEATDGFPLFEVCPAKTLRYLLEPPSAVDRQASQQTVTCIAKWLRKRGIDLIFVPVPKMTDVYADHFVSGCPEDGIVAPHVRRLLFDLLQNDVEVVDVAALFHPIRRDEYLYYPHDTHWASAGQRITAAEIARRLDRYPQQTFGRSNAELVLRPEAECPYVPDGLPCLTDQQQRRAAEAIRTMSRREVHVEPGPQQVSPVTLVGDSYLAGFRELLIYEADLPVRSVGAGDARTEPFWDFARDPDLLRDVRVVVWVMSGWKVFELGSIPPAMAN